MKKYAAFAGHDEALGGWNDYIGAFEKLDEAASFARTQLKEQGYNWWHVVDLEALVILGEGSDLDR